MWHLIPYTYLQGQAGESLPTNCLATEQLAQLKLRRTPEMFCLHDSLTEDCLDSLFGTTSALLEQTIPTPTALLKSCEKGEGSLPFVAASLDHAKTLAWQEKGQDLTAHEVGSGQNLRGLLAKYDPESHLLKTAQHSLLGGLSGCFVTLPRWGTMQAGGLYQRPTLVQTTSVSVYGFMLPTPVSSDATMGAVIGKNDQYYTTSTGMPRKVNGKGSDGSVGLARLVQMWPTPSATDYKGAGANGALRDRLDYATERGGTKSNTFAPPTVIGGKLNPVFVEWMMGWPANWTALTPIKTRFCRYGGGALERVTLDCEHRANRLKAIGNGQVPLCAATAWQLLSN